MHKEKYMHPSNFKLHVLANSQPELQHAVHIAFEGNKTVVKFWKVEDGWLHLYQYDGSTSGLRPLHPLPFAMSEEPAWRFIWDWLGTVEPEDDHLDHDGSNDPDAWELIGDNMGEVLRVRKTWSEYHK